MKQFPIRRFVNAALTLALHRYHPLFFQKPILKGLTITHDGTLFSKQIFQAVFADSLELLLDEIEDLCHGKPSSRKEFLGALQKAAKRKYPVVSDRKWVPALDGMCTEEEFTEAVHRQIRVRMKQRAKKVRPLLKRAEIRHLWEQIQDLGPEAQETVSETLLDPKIGTFA